MAFESQHGLAMDGVASTGLWQALLSARAHRRFNQDGYSYALAAESSPESLTLYHNGRVVLRTPANTGIGDKGTAQGTFPVFERLRSQTMQGTNPDGSHYADFVQWVAYFNGGDAVHYMPRASYGSHAEPRLHRAARRRRRAGLGHRPTGRSSPSSSYRPRHACARSRSKTAT